MTRLLSARMPCSSWIKQRVCRPWPGLPIVFLCLLGSGGCIPPESGGVAKATLERNPDVGDSPDARVVLPAPRWQADDPAWFDAVPALDIAEHLWRADLDFDEGLELPFDAAVVAPRYFAEEVTTGNPWSDWLRKPAVQFGCAGVPTPLEDCLEEDLKSPNPDRKLIALVALLKWRAPASTPEQWAVLQSMVARCPREAALLEEMHDTFSAGRLLRSVNRLALAVPSEDLGRDGEWSIMAAGVTRVEAALPALATLSTSPTIDTSLSAQLAITQFQGPAAEEALLTCVLGGTYDAFIRAGDELVRRNPARLRETLEQLSTTDLRLMPYYGLMLADCDSPSGVPWLCRAVGSYQGIDREMFDQIERLARPDDLAEVKAMLETCRLEQRERAVEVWEAINRRFETLGLTPSGSGPSVDATTNSGLRVSQQDDGGF